MIGNELKIRSTPRLPQDLGKSYGLPIVKRKRWFAHDPSYEGSSSDTVVRTLPLAPKTQLIANLEKHVVVCIPFSKVLPGYV